MLIVFMIPQKKCATVKLGFSVLIKNVTLVIVVVSTASKLVLVDALIVLLLLN